MFRGWGVAAKAGVPDDKIILDPGVGFGKTYEMNLEIMKHLEILHRLGYPVLLGTSRKSMKKRGQPQLPSNTSLFNALF